MPDILWRSTTFELSFAKFLSPVPVKLCKGPKILIQKTESFFYYCPSKKNTKNNILPPQTPHINILSPPCRPAGFHGLWPRAFAVSLRTRVEVGAAEHHEREIVLPALLHRFIDPLGNTEQEQEVPPHRPPPPTFSPSSAFTRLLR